MAEPGQVRAAESSPRLEPIPPVPPPALANAIRERRMDPSSGRIRDLEWQRYIRLRRGEHGELAPDDLTGIALSGGGMRSAIFALGVLQALARHDLLRRFDYLSTVSGSGYIGASLTWLTSSWVTDRALAERTLLPSGGFRGRAFRLRPRRGSFSLRLRRSPHRA